MKRILNKHLRGIRNPALLIRYAVVGVGLAFLNLETIPRLEKDLYRLPEVALWLCVAYFAWEWIYDAIKNRASAFLSARAFVHATSVLPVPIAFMVGVSGARAWLFGTFWVLKLLPTTLSELPQLVRVISKEAKSLASVLILYLIVLFSSCVGVYIFEAEKNPTVFKSLPATLWWGLFASSTAGIGEGSPRTLWGHVLGAFVMISGFAVLGLWMGILANGLMEETRRREFVQVWDLVVKIPFLKSIGAAAIAEIARMLHRVDFPEGTVVIRRGTTGDCMYFVVSGEVQVQHRSGAVHLGAGSFFGEMALLGDYTRNATVMTTKATTLLVLDAADFRGFAANHPEFSQAIESEAAARGQEAHVNPHERQRA